MGGCTRQIWERPVTRAVVVISVCVSLKRRLDPVHRETRESVMLYLYRLLWSLTPRDL
jgi:hypothetical protein